MKGMKLEIMTVRVPEGTLACIDQHLKGGELRSAFIREAVEAEIARRLPVQKAGQSNRQWAGAEAVDAALKEVGLRP